ncbi:MAG: MFS transporter [marine bacterium B5-7]|nr:MAG: MFS transporter [marine bacterium B5-7]
MRKSKLLVNLKRTWIPLTSLLILMLGSSFLITLTVLRLRGMHAPSLMIGAMTAVLYAGSAAGSFRAEPFIARVKHVRAFATFASIFSITCLLQGLWLNPWFWLVLRFLNGYAIAGLFIVIESWLLAKSTAKTRGAILSLYMIALYCAQSAGQFFINLKHLNSLQPFVIIGVLTALAVLPLAMGKVRMPHIEAPSTLDFKKLYKKAASGMVGALCGGLIQSSMYGLLPLYLRQQHYPLKEVSYMMALTIFGGMCLQYPMGRLSDVIERRFVLALICFASILICTQIILAHHLLIWMCVALFVLGGLTFTVYPISISYGCDALSRRDIVAGTQGLLLAYSIGAMVGPIVSPLFMDLFGSAGLFIYFMIISGLLGAFLMWRRTQKTAKPQDEPFVLVPQTTPISAELDPRMDEEVK